MEIFAIYIQGVGVNLLIIINCSGSRPADLTFFDEFAAVVKHVVMSELVVIISDVNIHRDDPSLPTSINFNNIISGCDLKQHLTMLATY